MIPTLPVAVAGWGLGCLGGLVPALLGGRLAELKRSGCADGGLLRGPPGPSDWRAKA